MERSLHRDWTRTHGEGKSCNSCPPAKILLFVRKFLHPDTGLGDGLKRHARPSAHKTQQFPGRSCSSVLWRVVVGPPLAGRRRPCGALVNRGLWLVTHPGKPKALRWSQNIFGLSTNYRYYGSPFLSWNLKPKALSCWSAEDSQIAKYLVMNLKGNNKSTICIS